MRTLLGIVGILLVVIIVGAVLGWWADLVNLLTGTIGPPEGGYTCLPTCDETDGKFLSMPGHHMASFSNAPIIVWVMTPINYPGDEFTVGFFDGDAGKDDAGNIVGRGSGNWDETTTETTYTLYADPAKNGQGNKVVETWSSNDMANNAWVDFTVKNTQDALAPNTEYFFYRLEITRTDSEWGINALKLRTNGYISTGRSDLTDSSFAIVAMAANWDDYHILYPDWTSGRDYGESVYTGDWAFYIIVPDPSETFEIWDGDFDRGTASTEANDTDDFNTPARPIPEWATDAAVEERAGGRGAPADDYRHPINRRYPPVQYTVTDKDGTALGTNAEPSGTEEWEHFIMSVDSGVSPDTSLSEKVAPGKYILHIEGLDIHNTVWLRANYCIATHPDACRSPWKEGSCPRTIGYWKNNVAKVLDDKKAQESRESIEWALRNIALESELFRHGLDVQNPQPISDPTPLTLEEAHVILQRDTSASTTYPGGAEQAQTMLARALQQNLASWLNLGSGKVGDTTMVSLDVPDGTFVGPLLDALKEAEDIILYGGNLERAKDIGDLINNGLWGEDAPDDLACDEYESVIPPDLQPPPYNKIPKAPKPKEPPKPTPGPEVTCDAPRVNTYGVEITNEPFEGIKFEFQSGTEVKNSDFEEFQVVLTADEAAALTSVKMEAKAGTNVGEAELSGCMFDQDIPCGEPIYDANSYFAFSFVGAADNGDGTLTLTFQVQNFTDQGLSHATIGVVPSSPPSRYESEVCVD